MSNPNPLVSFCILTYNQERFIQDAILGAIHQEYPNLEIIISDDCSIDRTYDVILETVEQYKNLCPHKIVVNRNAENLGIAEHCNKVLYELAKGDILVLAGGDDVSLPGRTSESVSCFEMHPEVMSLSFASEQVDVNLISLPIQQPLLCPDTVSVYTLEDYINFKDFIIFSGDSRALRRIVIEKFPPIKIADAEDIYLFIRSLLLGSVAYIRKPLQKRRMHGNNVSVSRFRKDAWEKGMKQMQYDADYAFDKKYISAGTYNCVNRKIDSISKMFYKEGVKRNLTLRYPALYKFYKYIKSFISR